jgi:ubiquinone/menaquinone biosynthesis C-methylase UbiE
VTNGMPNAEFICCDAHNLPYENGTFDHVIVNSLLHHLDLVIILKEIKRVLKPGGSLILKEPLGTNPIINIYRMLTPNSRTPDERPFNFSDLKLLSNYFDTSNINFYGGVVLLSAFKVFKPFKTVFFKVDVLLSITPLKYLFWSVNGALQVK